MGNRTVWVLVETYPDAGPEVTVFASRATAWEDIGARALASGDPTFEGRDGEDVSVIAQEFLQLWSGEIELVEQVVLEGSR